MDERLQQIFDALAAGRPLSYEDAADLFELTETGRRTGTARARLLELLHAKFADEAALTRAMRGFLAQYTGMMAHDPDHSGATRP